MRAAGRSAVRKRASTNSAQPSSTIRNFRIARTSRSSRVEAPERLRILIWERGVGPTQASGTGACGAAVAAASYGGASRGRRSDLAWREPARRVARGRDVPDRVGEAGVGRTLAAGQFRRNVRLPARGSFSNLSAAQGGVDFRRRRPQLLRPPPQAASGSPDNRFPESPCPLFAERTVRAAIAARGVASERVGTRAASAAASRWFGSIEQRGDLAQPALGAAAQNGLLVGGFLGRSLRALAAVQRVVQRQPIVALRDGFLRLLQRLDGGLVLVGGVTIGARRPCGIDRALGLIHLSRWRRAASRAENSDKQRSAQNTAKKPTRHLIEYTLRPQTHEGALACTIGRAKNCFASALPGLGDNELIAIVVGSGSRRGNALTLANEILESTGGLHGIPRSRRDDLRRIDGMGRRRRRRCSRPSSSAAERCCDARRRGCQFGTPRDVAAYLLPQFGSRPVEQFGVVMLDTKHRLLRTSVVSVGTLDSSPAHPREIFREAASAWAAAIVLFHNHPSGDPTAEPRRCGADAEAGAGGRDDGHRRDRSRDPGRHALLQLQGGW